MVEKPEHIRYIQQTLEAGISRQTLMDIYKLCAPRAMFCLVGFNDYTKHIINLLPGAIEHIIDDDSEVLGLKYRGKEVVSSDVDIKSLCAVVTKYEYLSHYTSVLKRKKTNIAIQTAGNFEGKSTRFADPYVHTPYLKYIFDTWERAPNTMMAKNKIQFFCELFRSCSQLPGDVAEFGVWQGGSAYALMRGAKFLGVEKKFYLFDLFESLKPTFKEAIMCDDEVKRKLSPYGDFEFISGDMNEEIKKYKKQKFCFVHYDLGYHPETLDYLLKHTVKGGVIVFDNYGFSTASPALYQDFFSERSEEVISVPFSEQGVLIKRGK